ncbi:MAG: PD40 domain-containing protein [Bacteroidetes bacterium]|nr:PD40 domain-containing protein [Bacteroidota bacterium]
MKHFICLFLVFISGIALLAQEDLEEKGKFCFSKKNYVDALPIYKKLFEQEPDNIDYNYCLAVCYLNTFSNRENAISHLEYISQKKNDSEIWYFLGLAYQYSNRFEDAINVLEKSKLHGDKLAGIIERQIETCFNGKELVKFPLDVTFQNLGKSINTKYPDYFPFIPADESFMVFTSRREENVGSLKELDGYYSSDIYISYPKDGQWINTKGLSPMINTAYDEKAVDISGTGKKMIVYLDRIDSLGNIYYSDNTKTGFQKITRFNGDVNTAFETSGSISQDENTLIFSSKRSGGLGGTDLYIAHKIPNGKWGTIQNLGPIINTRYNEDFPHLSLDGKTLYFASEGHSSMGGFDIFKTVLNEEKNTWLAPQNLGYPINNAYDNMSISFAGDSTQAYLSTVKEDGLGDLDLFKVKFNNGNKRYCIITGKVTTNDTTETNLKITILAAKDASKEVLRYVPIKKSGKYVMALEPGNYKITISSENMKETIIPLTIFDVPFQPEMTKDFILSKAF